VTRLRAGGPRSWGSIPGSCKRLSSVTSRPGLGPTHPPIQSDCEYRGLFPPGVNLQERKTDHSAEVKNGGAILALFHTSSWRDPQLNKPSGTSIYNNNIDNWWFRR
jgi:hypothetical protein